MARAVKYESGAESITTSAMGGFRASMKTTAPKMVNTPCTRAVSPCSSPSETASASLTKRLTVSPRWVWSKKPTGRVQSLRNSAPRRRPTVR